MMMRPFVSLLLLAASAIPSRADQSPMLRSSSTTNGINGLTAAGPSSSSSVADPPSIYDCLQAAVTGDDCRAAFDGQCVWCKEPIAGLCVTPKAADKMKLLPFFKCDPHNTTKVLLMEEEVHDDSTAGAW